MSLIKKFCERRMSPYIATSKETFFNFNVKIKPHYFLASGAAILRSNNPCSFNFGSNLKTSEHFLEANCVSNSASILLATCFKALPLGGPGAAFSTLSFSSSAKENERAP